MLECEGLKIAIQKSGRLTEPTIDLLKGCDLKFTITDRVDIAHVRNPDIYMDILLMRSRDIPDTLINDDVDLGIVGYDIFRESQAPLVLLMPLGYGACRISLGVKKEVPYAIPADLTQAVVATSYPNIAQKFFDSQGVRVQLRPLGGSVELAARVGKANAVVDAVDSGESMRTNGLEEKEVIMESEAWLVASPRLKQQKNKREIVENFLIRSLSYLRPKLNRWISMNVPSELKEDILNTLLPYSQSPTVSLCELDMLDIASIIPTNRFWDIIAELKAKGARDIAELAMKRLIPDPDDSELMRIMYSIFEETE